MDLLPVTRGTPLRLSFTIRSFATSRTYSHFPPTRRRFLLQQARVPFRPKISKHFSISSRQGLAEVKEDFDPSTQDRESDEVDVCIVGGGPAGLSAAIRLKQLATEAGNKDLRVLLLEKASDLGAHIVSGNVIEPSAISELLPDWLSDDNPSRFDNATPATNDKMRFLTRNQAIPIPRPPQMNNHGNYIISLNQFTKWLGERAEEIGVEVYPGFAASEILYNSDQSVKGVATNDLGISKSGAPKSTFERGMEFHARVTLFAEGCHGSLTKQIVKKFNLRQDSQPQTYALGLKEVWEVPPEQHRNGEVVHSMGYPLDKDTYGGGWLYHFGDNLVSVGLVVGLDYPNPWTAPYGEFQKMKHHPLYASVLKGGKPISYAARTLNEGGFQSIPKCAFPGGALIGDTAGFLNVPKIKGTHTAMRSGMLAAQAAYKALTEKSASDSAIFLYDYEDSLRNSTIWSELYQVRNMRPSFHGPLGLYGGIIYSGLEAYLFRGKAPWTLKHRAQTTQLRNLRPRARKSNTRNQTANFPSISLLLFLAPVQIMRKISLRIYMLRTGTHILSAPFRSTKA